MIRCNRLASYKIVAVNADDHPSKTLDSRHTAISRVFVSVLAVYRRILSRHVSNTAGFSKCMFEGASGVTRRACAGSTFDLAVAQVHILFSNHGFYLPTRVVSLDHHLIPVFTVGIG